MSSASSKGHSVEPAVPGTGDWGHSPVRFCLLYIKKQVRHFFQIPMPENVLFFLKKWHFCCSLTNVLLRHERLCLSSKCMRGNAISSDLLCVLDHVPYLTLPQFPHLYKLHYWQCLYIRYCWRSNELGPVKCSEQNLACSMRLINSRHH